MKKSHTRGNIFAALYALTIFCGGLFSIALITIDDIKQFTDPLKFSLAQAWKSSEAIPSVSPVENLPVPEVIPIRKTGSQPLVLPSASAAAIVDVASGEQLYEKNSTQKRAIASITKLFTAMLVIDEIQDLQVGVVIPEEVILIEGTRVGCVSSVICEGQRLISGDKVSAKALLEAMLVGSANDAATALAIHIGGSEQGFAQIMNERARELNLTSSNFCRPSGLELSNTELESQCFSSARDLGVIMATLVKEEKYQQIEEILKMKSTTFTGEDDTILHETVSTNKLLTQDFGFEVVGKTGFTLRAGPSLIMMGREPDTSTEIVAVVLNDQNRFENITKMLKWAYENHSWDK